MLSRVANSLYWMMRYIERAENTARILDVNLQLLLDARSLDEERLLEFWTPIVQSTGDEEHFKKLYGTANGTNVTEFLAFNKENANSILSSISQARENARMVRDQITFEMWEEINRLYLYMRSNQARREWENSPQDFFHAIKSGSLQFQGLVNATVPHNEGYYFMQVGKLLERADKTTRMLDVCHSSVPAGEAPLFISPAAALEWSAVLRSCSAWDAYHQIHGADVGPRRAVQLLILSDEFPRSVRFCIAALDDALRRISGIIPRRFSNEAERLSGKLLAELDFAAVDEIFDEGLHEYLDRLQTSFNDIGDALFAIYIFQPFHDDYPGMQQQQQQQ